mgnify:FL=1
MSKLSKKSQTAKDKAMNTAVLRTACLLGITVNATILYVLKDIKKEQCACDDNDLRHVFCTYYAMFLIALNSALLVLGSKEMLQQIAPLMNVLNLVNVLSLVTYLHKLASTDCNCEFSSIQRVVRHVYYLIAFFYIVAVINAVFFVFSIYTQKD